MVSYDTAAKTERVVISQDGVFTPFVNSCNQTGRSAHADTADAGEVQLLRLQKHLSLDWLQGVNESTDGHYRIFALARQFQQSRQPLFAPQTVWP